jgi:hypothetical protein
LKVKGVNGAEGGTRTRMDLSTRPSNVRVYQFHHFGTEEYYYNNDYVFNTAGCQTSDGLFRACSLFTVDFPDLFLQTMSSTGAVKLNRESC